MNEEPLRLTAGFTARWSCSAQRRFLHRNDSRSIARSGPTPQRRAVRRARSGRVKTQKPPAGSSGRRSGRW